jgi:hypothetical protein
MPLVSMRTYRRWRRMLSFSTMGWPAPGLAEEMKKTAAFLVQAFSTAGAYLANETG